MNYDRISQVADLIEQVGDNCFDMETYVRGDTYMVADYFVNDILDDEVMPECGTTGCIAGWALSIAEVMYPQVFAPLAMLSGTQIKEEARRFLDLTPNEADQLFFDDSALWAAHGRVETTEYGVDGEDTLVDVYVEAEHAVKVLRGLVDGEIDLDDYVLVAE